MKKKNIFIIGIIIIIFLAMCSIIYFSFDSKLSKREVKKYLEKYNQEYSLNLPKDYKILYTYTLTAIDGQENLIIVSPNNDYKLEYKKQCESEIHEEFDILEHFYKASKRTIQLQTYASKLSNNYDWYAYEVDKGARTYNLFVVYDEDNNYLFVYYIVTQYTDVF